MQIYGVQEAHLDMGVVAPISRTSLTAPDLPIILKECGTSENKFLTSESDEELSQCGGSAIAKYMLCTRSTSASWRVMIRSVCSTMHLAAGEPAFT